MRRAAPAAVFACAVLGLPASAPAAVKPNVSVMSRNLNLGGNLKLGTNAATLQELVDQAGVILKQVDGNRFPVRARGLATEIRTKDPDLVGLQEVALWRTGPCTENPIPPRATQVRYDYLKLLLSHLGGRYRVVSVEPEFDFEVYVNVDGDQSTSQPGCPFGSELNGRLTMRDVVLARKGRVTTSHVRAGHFRDLLQVRPGGVAVNVTRGWIQLDAKLRGVPRFHFVNTHLEAFDNQPTGNHSTAGGDVDNGRIREAQAKELIARRGPARSRLPVVLLGDLNSDLKTPLKPGDSLAFQALLRAGFVERDTRRPLSCCIESPSGLLTFPANGRLSDFNHKVDAVMTDSPKRVRLVRGAVTGRRPVNGFWDSDHAGLFSALRVS
jgi:hypothetical protein